MKGFRIMIFNYIAMMGTPVLLAALAVTAALGIAGTVRTILLLLIAAGCLVYGAVGIREAFVHGGGKRASTPR